MRLRLKLMLLIAQLVEVSDCIRTAHLGLLSLCPSGLECVYFIGSRYVYKKSPRTVGILTGHASINTKWNKL